MMIEITTEKKSELMEHAAKAYEHVGKMLECIEGMDPEGGMGQREGDEWYIKQLEHRGGYGDRYGMRMGRREGYIMNPGSSGMEQGQIPGGMGYGNRRPNAGGYNGGLGMREGGYGYGDRYQKMDPYYS